MHENIKLLNTIEMVTDVKMKLSTTSSQMVLQNRIQVYAFP